MAIVLSGMVATVPPLMLILTYLGAYNEVPELVKFTTCKALKANQ